MNSKETQGTYTSPFDAIQHASDEGSGEYWSARELYKLLGYSRWEKFQQSLEEAKVACEQSGQPISDHFHLQVKMIKAGKSAKRAIEDYRLTRFACYLAVVSTKEQANISHFQANTSHFQANTSHFQVGREVREAIKRLDGTMPEDLPTPTKSIQQIQRDEQKRIQQRQQPALFEEPQTLEG